MRGPAAAMRLLRAGGYNEPASGRHAGTLAAPTKEAARMRRHRLSRRLLLLLSLTGPVLAACGAAPAPRRGLTARPASDEWPPIFWRATPEVQAAYRYAVAQPALLAYIPCFCGCAEQGHISNRDCYLLADDRSGTVLLDEHGFGCGGCVGVTHDVMRWQALGLPPAAIRTAVDQKWRATGPATDTPLPPS